MRRLGFVYGCVLVLLLCGAALPASAARRIALVMGNANYLYANVLTNPVNDANLLAGVLQAQGFEVTAAMGVFEAPAQKPAMPTRAKAAGWVTSWGKK